MTQFEHPNFGGSGLEGNVNLGIVGDGFGGGGGWGALVVRGGSVGATLSGGGVISNDGDTVGMTF